MLDALEPTKQPTSSSDGKEWQDDSKENDVDRDMLLDSALDKVLDKAEELGSSKPTPH